MMTRSGHKEALPQRLRECPRSHPRAGHGWGVRQAEQRHMWCIDIQSMEACFEEVVLLLYTVQLAIDRVAVMAEAFMAKHSLSVTCRVRFLE